MGSNAFIQCIYLNTCGACVHVPKILSGYILYPHALDAAIHLGEGTVLRSKYPRVPSAVAAVGKRAKASVFPSKSYAAARMRPANGIANCTNDHVLSGKNQGSATFLSSLLV